MHGKGMLSAEEWPNKGKIRLPRRKLKILNIQNGKMPFWKCVMAGKAFLAAETVSSSGAVIPPENVSRYYKARDKITAGNGKRW